MKKYFTFGIIVFLLLTISCSKDEAKTDIADIWVYDSGTVPEAEIISAKVTFKDNGAYKTGYFELSVKNITYASAVGKSDNITLQIDFPKDVVDNDNETPRPAYNIKGSTDYVKLIKELYAIDDTPTLDWDSYPGKLRVNDELFESMIFKHN